MKKHNIDFEDILMDHRTEEDFRSVPLKNGVFTAIFFILVFVCFVLISQLFFTNAIKGSFYKGRSALNITDERIEEAPRGVVIDRFGEPLLYNEPAFKVVLVPRDFPENTDERILLIKEVGRVLGISKDELNRKIGERDWGQSDRLLVKENPTHDELVALKTLGISGVYVEPSFKRVSKNPNVFSHTLGYTGLVNREDITENPLLAIDDKIGRGGLELFYDDELRGENGKSVFLKDAKGKTQEKKSIKESEQGKTLETFIDGEFQEYIYSRFIAGLSQIGRNSGVVIAINPQNGEVLSLVSVPGYDANDLGSALLNSANPLFNRAVMGLYNPGSTIKPLVATAALTEGVVTPNTQIYSAGFIEIPNPYYPELPSRFLDWKAHGWVNVHSALARSSNVYFYEVTGGFQNQTGMGILKLNAWWKIFRLDQKTGIDLPGELSGFLPDPEWKERERNDPWRVGDTYNVAIGQGDFMITPIELLTYISAVSNGGKFYKPRVVKSIKNEKGEDIKIIEPEILSDIGKKVENALPDVTRGMRDAVMKDYGTARLLSDLPVSVGAKTGTAQIQNNQKTNSFFVGFAPFDSPEIAIIVLVENSREGSLNTVPIAKDILMWYYKNRLKDK